MQEPAPEAFAWSAVGADAIAATHALFVGFVVWGELGILVGALAGWEWARYLPFRAAHLGAVAFVGGQDLLGRVCPLTVWEHQLRRRAGQSPASTPFIGRLVHQLLMCHLSERTQKIMRLSFAAVVLATLVLVPPRWTIE